MLAAETQELERLKDQYAYTNFQLNNEFLRVIGETSTEACRHYSEFGSLVQLKAEELHELSLRLISNLENSKLSRTD